MRKKGSPNVEINKKSQNYMIQEVKYQNSEMDQTPMNIQDFTVEKSDQPIEQPKDTKLKLEKSAPEQFYNSGPDNILQFVAEDFRNHPLNSEHFELNQQVAGKELSAPEAGLEEEDEEFTFQKKIYQGSPENKSVEDSSKVLELKG
jgi:hypothetical protein